MIEAPLAPSGAQVRARIDNEGLSLEDGSAIGVLATIKLTYLPPRVDRPVELTWAGLDVTCFGNAISIHLSIKVAH